jgi:hypothetical protein
MEQKMSNNKIIVIIVLSFFALLGVGMFSMAAYKVAVHDEKVELTKTGNCVEDETILYQPPPIYAHVSDIPKKEAPYHITHWTCGNDMFWLKK